MAQYTPSFVDTSGMTQGLIRGMQQAAQIKQQQDLLVQKDIDEFEKNYDPRRLKEEHIPEFTMAFKQYKEAALRYSRLNRGGAKPEEIAIASALKDKALANMNSMYQNSTAIANKQAEYAEVIKNARLNGLPVDDQLNANYAALQTMNPNQKPDNIPSALSFDFRNKGVDYKKLNDAFELYGGKTKAKQTEIGEPVVGADGKPIIGTNGKEVRYTNVNTYEYYDLDVARKGLASRLPFDASLAYDAKIAKNQLISGINAGNQNALNAYKELIDRYGVAVPSPTKDNPKNVVKTLPIENIDDSMALAATSYTGKALINTEQNTETYKIQSDIEKDKALKAYRSQVLAKKNEKEKGGGSIIVPMFKGLETAKDGDYSNNFSALTLPVGTMFGTEDSYIKSAVKKGSGWEVSIAPVGVPLTGVPKAPIVRKFSNTKAFKDFLILKVPKANLKAELGEDDTTDSLGIM